MRATIELQGYVLVHFPMSNALPRKYLISADYIFCMSTENEIKDVKFPAREVFSLTNTLLRTASDYP